MANSFAPGGCTQPAGLPDSGSSTGSLGALAGAAGGLAQAAMSGNLGEALTAMLKEKAVEMAKQAATAILMKIFTRSAAPKPPTPPWTGLGVPAAPGSAVAAAAMEAYNAAHNGPVLSNGGSACGAGSSAGGGSGAQGGGAPGGAGAQNSPGGGPYPYNPRGEPAEFEEWARGLLGLEDDEEREAFLDARGLTEAEYYAELGITPDNYLDFSPLEEPWYASLLGGNMEDGYSALWGAIQLGSPKWPGAGTMGTWWVPDRFFDYDMSPYFSLHDNRFDSNRTLRDMDDVLAAELVSFLTGLAHTKDPIHVGLQTLYSSATLLVGVGSAAWNSFFRPDPQDIAFAAIRDHFARQGRS